MSIQLVFPISTGTIDYGKSVVLDETNLGTIRLFATGSDSLDDIIGVTAPRKDAVVFQVMDGPVIAQTGPFTLTEYLQIATGYNQSPNWDATNAYLTDPGFASVTHSGYVAIDNDQALHPRWKRLSEGTGTSLYFIR